MNTLFQAAVLSMMVWWWWLNCRRSCSVVSAVRLFSGHCSTAGRVTSAAATAGGRTAAESANKPLSTLRTLRWTDSSPSSSFPASIETLVVRRALLCLTNMITSLFVSSDLSSASISVMGAMWSPQQRWVKGLKLKIVYFTFQLFSNFLFQALSII